MSKLKTVANGGPWLLVGAALLSIPIAAAGQEPNLLPTAVFEQQLRDIHTKLGTNSLSAEERQAYFSQVKAKVSEFIIAQLQAEPRLEPRHLRDQLVLILGRKGQAIVGMQSDSRAEPDPEEPFIQRWPPSWGPREKGPIVWGVVYSDTHHLGFMGNRIVVESYVLNQGKARLAGRGGSELDGVALHADGISNLKPALAVLIHGVVEWTSGHVLPGKAVLYSIDETGVNATWKTERPGLEAFGHPYGDGFTLLYHDEDRHQSTGDFSLTSVIEVYLVLPSGLKRIVNERY